MADWFRPVALVFIYAMGTVAQPALLAGAVEGAHCIDTVSLCMAVMQISSALIDICTGRGIVKTVIRLNNVRG